MSAPPAARRHAEIRVSGVVQGVGFRPFVLRRARELALTGSVRNDTRGVLVDVEGDPAAVARLIADLPRLAPPLARVTAVAVAEREPARTPAATFTIAASDGGGEPQALVSADGATCDACLAELRDPSDRRYRYPFVNCTDCGPRFTIVRGIPYDRPRTTMAGFRMCPRCQAEYDDPADRRFHAQPNACPECGPRTRLVRLDDGNQVAAAPRPARDRVDSRDGRPVPPESDAIAVAAALLRTGAIVAVKGLGGYHLACRADDERAVATLRARKHREDKPFAVMAADLGAAHALAVLGPEEEALLTSAARPIVLAPRRDGADVATAVAPARHELGVLLPYSPLHHLLLADVGSPLVMTSGNRSDEPIAYRDEDARERLAGIADALLVHDRPIHMRTDDSVTRVAAGRRTVLRRSRGLVPERLALPVPTSRPLLACGAHLKSTFCVAKGDGAWVSHHVGDLDDPATRRSFVAGIAHFEALFAVAPELLVHDLHPDYASTAYALDREGVDLLAVQHHHAHLAAVLAEHGCAPDQRAVGAIFDGSGLGHDGAVWGGELLVGDLRTATRAGHLDPVALPGGDRAARQPWRMAAAWLVAAGDAPAPGDAAPPDRVGRRDAPSGGGPAAPEGDTPMPALPAVLVGTVALADWRTVCAMAARGFASPPTTSMGRLFDAVAALCGVRAVCRYEGQAAIELEALADPGERGAYPLPVAADGTLDARPLIRAVAADVARGVGPATVSARFHRSVARATALVCAQLAGAHATEIVVLSGGVFQNRLLLERTVAALADAGLRVLVPERLPANDGAISFGQAAIAAATVG